MVTPLPRQNDPLAMIRAFTQPRRNQLAGLASGLLSGNDWGPGLAAGFAQAAQGRQADDAYAATQKAEAERQRQLQETIGYLRQQPGGSLFADAAERGMIDPKDAFKSWYEQSKGGKSDGMPANVREWEYFNALPDEQKAEYIRMKRANPYLDLGTGFGQPDPINPGSLGGPIIPKNGDVPTGFQQTAPGEIAPMPGSEPDRERQAGRVKAESALNTLEQKNAISIGAIDEALSQASGWNTGNVMGNIGAVPVLGQGALDLGKTLDTIKANIGFEELQTMRDNSPTGGALGAITERELAFLQSTIASIEQSQSEQQLKKNLQTLRDFLAASQDRRRAAYVQQYGGGGSQAPAGGMDDVDAILRDLGI